MYMWEGNKLSSSYFSNENKEAYQMLSVALIRTCLSRHLSLCSFSKFNKIASGGI